MVSRLYFFNLEIVELDNGEVINMLPFGVQHENNTKTIVGNGVIIDPKDLLNDLDALNNNGIDYSQRLSISDRCHLVTASHRKIKSKLREIRQDKIWLDAEDVCLSFKP